MKKDMKGKGSAPANTAENTAQHKRMAMGQKIDQGKKAKSTK